MKQKIKNILFKLKLKLFKRKIDKYKQSHKFNQKIALISSKKYKNNIKEDLHLQYALLKQKIDCTIESWEENNIKTNALIRSVWGYQNNIKEFKEFITNLPKKVINDKKVLLNNIDKQKQYKLLTKNKIPTIETEFITLKDLNNIDTKTKKVLKPIISASGNNTYLIKTKKELNNAIENFEKNKINNIMIQPFIKGIQNGELSIIVINNNIEYAIERYPGIFTQNQSLNYIDIEELDNDILELINKTINIKEYKNTAFMRIDIVNDNEEYKVMEVELLDPSLFIETIPDKVYKNYIYNKLAQTIAKKLK